MGNLDSTSSETQGLRELLAEVRTSFPPEFRRRQGKQWYEHWKSRAKNQSLVKRLSTEESIARMLLEDNPSDELLNCETLHNFLAFVDTEATGDWTTDYDTSISDLIMEGFLLAANDSYQFWLPQNSNIHAL